VETLFTILFFLPMKAVTKTEAPPRHTLGKTTPSVMFSVCKYSRPWTEKEREKQRGWPTQWRTGNHTHDAKRWATALTGPCALQSKDYRVVWKDVWFYS